MALPTNRIMNTTEIKQNISSGDLKQKSGSALPTDSDFCPDFGQMDNYVDLDTTTYVNDGYSLDRCATLGKLEFQDYINLQILLSEGGVFTTGNDDSLAISDDGKTVLYKNVVFEEQPDLSWTSTVLSTSLDGTSPGNSTRDEGNSISGDGNVIALGYYTATVNNYSNAGRVYIFRKNNGVWTEEKVFEASSPSDNLWLGILVDLNYDGSVLVAHSKDSIGFYYWKYSGSNWSTESIRNLNDADGSPYSMSLSNDGLTLAVGMVAANYGSSTANAGGIAIFKDDSNGSWTLNAKLYSNNVTSSDRLGLAVALSGDGNTVVGTSSLDDQSYGQAILFKYNNTSWVEYELLSPNTLSTNGFKGCALTNDGCYCTLGAFYESVSSSYSGAIYTYEFNSNTNTYDFIQKLLPTTTPHRGVGSRLEMSGDGNVLITKCTYYNQGFVFKS